MALSSSLAQRPRRFWNSLSFQAVFLGLLILLSTVFLTQVISLSTARDTLIQTADADQNAITQARADLMFNVLAEQINALTLLADGEALENAVVAQNASYSGVNEAQILQGILAQEAVWAGLADDDPLVLKLLQSAATLELAEYQALFPFASELIITDRYGAVVAALEPPLDYYHGNEVWWQRAWNNGTGDFYIDPELGFHDKPENYGLQFSLPVEKDNAVIGVIRATLRLDVIQTALQEGALQKGQSRTLLVNGDGEILADAEQIFEAEKPLLSGFVDLARTDQINTGIEYINDEQGVERILHFAPLATDDSQSGIKGLNWYVVVLADPAIVFAPINDAISAVILPIVGLVIGISLLLVFSIRSSLRPLDRLTATARRYAEGELSARVPVRGTIELQDLAESFNVLAQNLANTVETLEATVVERTRDLETVLAVNSRISTTLELERLLQDVSDLTKERFGLYHAHVYLLQDDRQTLQLVAGAGYIGRQMVSQKRQISLANPSSIVANAGRNRVLVTVEDTQNSENFLPHPLLPETRSELAVPLVARGELVGVMDVQSDKVNFFDSRLQNVFETLGQQVAAAISNARLYEMAERTSRREQALSTLSQRLQNAQNLDEVLQIASRELGKALRVSRTAIELRAPHFESTPASEPPQPAPQ